MGGAEVGLWCYDRIKSFFPPFSVIKDLKKVNPFLYNLWELPYKSITDWVVYKNRNDSFKVLEMIKSLNPHISRDTLPRGLWVESFTAFHLLPGAANNPCALRLTAGSVQHLPLTAHGTLPVCLPINFPLCTSTSKCPFH